MATNEDILDTVEVIAERIRDLETTVESLKNKPASVELGIADLEKIDSYVESISKNLISAIAEEHTRFTSKADGYTKSLAEKSKEVTENINQLLNNVQAKLHSDYSDASIMRSTYVRDISSSIINNINSNLSALNQTIESINKSSKYININANRFIKSTNKNNAIIIGLVTLFCGVFLGYYFSTLFVSKSAEEVFELFYRNKYDKEIAAPLEVATAEAEDFLKMKKKEANDYLKQKKEEADLYYKEAIEYADMKADEVYKKKMDLYLENAKAEVNRERNRKESNN